MLVVSRDLHPNITLWHNNGKEATTINVLFVFFHIHEMEMDHIICHDKDGTDLIYGMVGTTDFDTDCHRCLHNQPKVDTANQWS